MWPISPTKSDVAAPIIVPVSQPTSAASNASTVRALILLGGLRRRVSLYNKDPSVVTPFKPARPSKWGVLRTVVGANTLLTRLLDASRASADRSSFLQRMHAQQGKQTAVVVKASQDSDVGYQKLDASGVLDALSYASRQGLRHHKKVLLSLEAWWRCCCEMCGGVEEIDEGQYLVIFKKVYRGMVAEYDEEEAVSSVREDWEHDSGGQDVLTLEMFFDCIFELADVWTKESTADEYASFMDTLLAQIANRGQFVPDAKIEPGSGQPEDVEEEDEPEPEPEPEPVAVPVAVPVSPAPPRPSTVKPKPTAARPPARPPPPRPPPRAPPQKPSAAPRKLRQERLERVPVAPVTLNAFKRKRAIELIQAHIRGAHARRRMPPQRKVLAVRIPARRKVPVASGCFTRPFGCGATSEGGASEGGAHVGPQEARKCHMAASSASPRRRPPVQGFVCFLCSPRGVAPPPPTAYGGTAAMLLLSPCPAALDVGREERCARCGARQGSGALLAPPGARLSRPTSSTARPRVAAAAAAAAAAPRPATAPHRPYSAQPLHTPLAIFLAGGGYGGTTGTSDAPTRRPASARMPPSRTPWHAHAPSERPRTALGPAEHRARDDDGPARDMRDVRDRRPSRRAQSARPAARSGGVVLSATAASDAAAPPRARAASASTTRLHVVPGSEAAANTAPASVDAAAAAEAVEAAEATEALLTVPAPATEVWTVKSGGRWSQHVDLQAGGSTPAAGAAATLSPPPPPQPQPQLQPKAQPQPPSSLPPSPRHRAPPPPPTPPAATPPIPADKRAACCASAASAYRPCCTNSAAATASPHSSRRHRMATEAAICISLEAVCAARAVSMAASKKPRSQLAAPPLLFGMPPPPPPPPHSAQDAWLMSAAARRRPDTCALAPEVLRTLLEPQGYVQGPLCADFEGRLACCLHTAAVAEAPALPHQQQATGVLWLGKGTPGHPRTAAHFARLSELP